MDIIGIGTGNITFIILVSVLVIKHLYYIGTGNITFIILVSVLVIKHLYY